MATIKQELIDFIITRIFPNGKKAINAAKHQEVLLKIAEKIDEVETANEPVFDTIEGRSF